MKKALRIYSCWLIVFLFSQTNARSMTFDETRYINKRFKVSQTANLELINKYGDIDVSTWDKDSIVFDISIKAYSKQLGKLDDLFAKVDINFSSSGNFVYAETVWDNASVIKNASWDIRKILGSDEKVEIDYKIRCPKTMELEIENKFGNVNLNKYSGDLKISLAHGNFRADKLSRLELDMQYGKVRIDEVKDMDIEIRFGDIKIDKVDKFNLSSVSSDIDIDKIKLFMGDSKHDNISMEDVHTCKLEAAFSDVDIEELSGPITANLKFGSLTIDNSYTSNLTISGSNTDVEVYFSREISLDYSVNLVNGKSLTVANPYKAIQNGGGSDFQNYTGTYGKGVKQSKKASFQLKNSYVRLGTAD